MTSLFFPRKSFWKLYQSYGIIFLVSIGINCLALAVPIYINTIYVAILPEGAYQELIALSVLLVILVSTDSLLKIGRLYLTSWTGAKLEHLLRVNAASRFLGSTLDTYTRSSAATHLERLNSPGALREFYAAQVVTVLLDLFFALLFLAVMAYLGGEIVLVTVALIPLLVLATAFQGWRLRRAIHRRQGMEAERDDFLIHLFEGADTVKGMGLNSLLLQQLEPLQEKSAQTACQVTQLTSSIQNFGSLASQLNLLGLVTVGGVLILENRIHIGALVACSLLGGQVMQPLQSALSLWVSAQTVGLARQRLKEVENLPQEAGLFRESSRELLGNLEIHHLTYHDARTGTPLIDNLTFNLPVGQIATMDCGDHRQSAVLFRLMLGGAEPDRGQIAYDGLPLQEWNLRELRSRLAYISPREKLFNGTILENLTNFRTESGREAALGIAERLGIDEAVRRLPAGYYTQVGEGSSYPIPDGLRYLILMGRVLVNGATFLLFDADDRESEFNPDIVQRFADLSRRYRGKFTAIYATRAPQLLELADVRYRWAGTTLEEA